MDAGTPPDHVGLRGLRERGVACPQLHCRAWVRVWSSPVPMACLVAVALCAFTAAGNGRLTAVGQWIRRASQADLARLHAPWDPMAGRYRAPDEKTIRVLLDRLDPRALARALLGPRPHGRRRSG